MNQDNQPIIALDYGRRFVGVAISDENHQVAKVLDTIIYGRPTAIVPQIKKLTTLYNTQQVLIGLPLGLDAKPTQMSQEVTAFGKKLAEQLHVEIIYWNETNTSKLVDPRLKGPRTHSEAARIMLQEYLDFKNTGI